MSPNIRTELSLLELDKNSTPHTTICSAFLETSYSYNSYSFLYTDASKSSEGVGCALADSSHILVRCSLPDTFSILSAELSAIKLAVDHVGNNSEDLNFVICTDSLSAIHSILNVHSRTQHVFAERIACLLHEIHNRVVLMWVPSHVGIVGNELADKGAKEAATLPPVRDIRTPRLDFRPLLKSAINSSWIEEWRNIQQPNKLKSVAPDPSSSPYSIGIGNRRNQVVYCRLRTGHSALTHGFLLQRNDPPMCSRCDCPLSIAHILVDCPRYSSDRRDIGLSTTLQDIFRPDAESVHRLLDYAKKIQIYNLI